MNGHAVTNDGCRQTTDDDGENELRHINRRQWKREYSEYSDWDRRSIIAASPMACRPSSLVNLLMRSHHTDNNSASRITDDGFSSVGPAALVKLWKIFSLIYRVNVHCPDVCYRIARLQYLLKSMCAHKHASTPLHMCAYTHTHPHLCKPKNRPGMVSWEEEKPFYCCVVLFEILNSVYCNQNASNYSTPSKEPTAIHHPN